MVKANTKGFGSFPAPWSGYATAIMVLFAHLLILEYPDHHQNLISSSLYYPEPLHKISSQSVHNLLSNAVHKQTNRQTNATKNITPFATEVTNQQTLWGPTPAPKLVHMLPTLVFHLLLSLWHMG